MLISTLIIGIVIGLLSSNMFFNKKSNRFFVEPSKEHFKQKAVHLIKPDEAQLRQIENSISKFSDKMYLIERENNLKMYNTIDSFYIEIKPVLTQEQKEKFEKRLSRFNSIISK